jgi:hypothetical protein
MVFRPNLIQPMIDFQKRIRKRTGGILMWESLAFYRYKYFDVFDKEVRIQAIIPSVVMPSYAHTTEDILSHDR